MTFALPAEQEDFVKRNSRFMEVLPSLENRLNQVFLRRFESADQAPKVVFFLGRLIAKDFHEILLNCANGYGMAGLKLLRPMFEATMTAIYLTHRPDEAKTFLEYHYVHQRRGLKIAESVGVDLSDCVPKGQQEEIEAKYQAIKDHYRQVCPKCGAGRILDTLAVGHDNGSCHEPTACHRDGGPRGLGFLGSGRDGV